MERIASHTVLPEYQPPSCPLDESGRHALSELSSTRGTLVYEAQLKESTRNLGLCVGDLHERLSIQLDRLRILRERRLEKGFDKTPDEERLEKHLEAFENQADELTIESEQSLRSVIDHQAELQDQASVLSDLYTSAVTASNATGARTSRGRGRQQAHADAADSISAADENQEQKEPPVPVASTKDAYQSALAKKKAEYEALTPYQRYALNNDYAAFKKIWHDSAAGEEGPPLPDASRWFRPDGQPVMTRPGAKNSTSNPRGSADAAADDQAGEDDDDDIAIAREVVSLNCPLTLRQLVEPYTHVECRHTFEKSAILEYLPVRGSVKCPQTGCNQTMSKARFDQDFHFDEAKLRRIQRAAQAQRDLDDVDDDDDDEDEDSGDDNDKDDASN
ncbi:hypothetical protein E4U60_006026 [Claviceps pazoutovae]|uniref:SP-RING-type domain-containing protein n=1 Tax=Claviceps pazoutovae TaxID=1649127 RepID=A0A9P7MGI9_9HYPO|nr:hypothetical protein E4U60_006026 [Claviceps pazoutovae]